jgi:dipeptidyl aminopeptidase/acylaminoacyl peptidase
MRGSKAYPLVSRDVFFGTPERARPSLSPDGRYLSFLAEDDGVLNLWVAPRAEPERAVCLTHARKRAITHYVWAFDSRHLLYLQDSEGDEQWHVYVLDVPTGLYRDLTPLTGVTAGIHRMSPRFPEEILLALNDRSPTHHDLHRVNFRTGESTLVLENPGFTGFISDGFYKVRFGMRVLPDGGTEYLRRMEDGGWISFMKVSMVDAISTKVIDLDADGHAVYLADSRGRSTSALTRVSLETGETEVLAEDPRVDIDTVLGHPTEGRIQAVSFQHERLTWRVLDPEIQRCFDELRAVDRGDIHILSRTQDDAHWLVAFMPDDGPVRYHRYEPESHSSTLLFSNRRALEGLRLSRMHPVTLRSRDGLELVSYLSLPPWAAPEGQSRPAEPLPLVLLVHGGPWARVGWGYEPSSQWLTHLGYATLMVNFRGSMGFGSAFLNAGNREWGGKMQEDLIDAMEWAIREGIADPARIAIMGSSYGGYAALAGLAFTPERFACAVDLCGPSNLVTFLEAVPPYWAPMINLFTTRIGDHRTEEGRRLLLERSPLQHANRIKRPLLVAHGANDPRVKEAEARRMVEALRESGVPVLYLLYSDEGHGIVRPENQRSFFAITGHFLSRFLGGCSEPLGEVLQHSSVQVIEGAELLQD